jgi:hypothetical protein
MSSNETAKLSKEQVDTFSALWSELDVHATNMLSVHCSLLACHTPWGCTAG